MFNLSEYRRNAELFSREKEQALHQFKSGQVLEPDLQPVFDKYGKYLYRDNIVHDIVSSIDSGEAAETRSKECFLKFALEQQMDNAIFSVDKQIAYIHSESDYDYFQSKIRQSTTSDEALHIYKRLKKCKNDTKALYVERMKIQKGILLNDSASFFHHSNKKALSLLKEQLKQFISVSTDYYCTYLDIFARSTLSISSGDLKPWHIPLILQGAQFDNLFKDWSPISLVKRTLMGLGVDLKKIENITIDTVNRRRKSIEPYCARVSVPEEIYVSLYPVGGVADVLNLFHLLGQALQAAHVSSKQPFEFSNLGDGAIWQTWGFLFQYLLLNDEWLKDFLRLEDSKDFRDFLHFRKLYLLRSEAVSFLGGLLYLEGESDIDDDWASRVAFMKSEVMGHEYECEFAFSSFKNPFKTIDYLRGWIFEAELREILVRRFGKRWYSRPGAGDYLKELWAYGQRFDAVELASKIRLLELDINPLTRELELESNRFFKE